MRIAIATAVYYPQINGVAVFSHNLARGLAQRGHEVIVLTPSQKGKSYAEEQDGVKVCYLKSVEAKVYPDQIHETSDDKRWWHRHGFRVSVFPGNEVRRILDEFQPEVVHVQVSDPVGLSVVSYARKRGIPVVTTEHNQPEILTETMGVPRVMRKGANAVLSAYFRKRQSKSDFATMPTERAIRNLLGKHELGVPIAAVSNGVDLKRFKPGEADGEVYAKYGLKRGIPTVLYVGRVDPEKKVGTVIEAVKRLRKEWGAENVRGKDIETEGRKDAGAEKAANDGAANQKMEARTKVPKTGVDLSCTELVVVGDGVDRARLMRKYGREAWVHFLGRVMPPDLYELYKMGWVFVTASEVETQGIVLIEAAAVGLPLVAVNAGAVGEICIDGENGYLCRPGVIEEMAEAISRILADGKLRAKFAKASIRIASEHDLEKTLDRFTNIYHKVIRMNKEGSDA